MSKTLRVLITGAARGIGMATAQVLANRGHSVVATDVSALSGSDGTQAHVLDVTSVHGLSALWASLTIRAASTSAEHSSFSSSYETLFHTLGAQPKL